MKSRQQMYRDTRGYIYYAQICNPNESYSQDIQVQYEIQSIVSHRFKQEGLSEYLTPQQSLLLQKPLAEIPDEQLQYLVKWVGHDQNSWQPGQNLKNAPQILESYKNFYSENKDMSNLKTTTTKTRGRKPKNGTCINEKSRTSKRRSFNFNRIYKESDNLKICEDEEDDLEIIDKETYIKGIKEIPNQQYYTKTIKCQEDKIEHPRRLKKKAEKIDQEANELGIDLNYYNIESYGRQQKIAQQSSKQKKIIHESISSNQFSPINKRESPQQEPQPINHILQALPQVRERSIMITQQQKYIDEDKPIRHDRIKAVAQNQFSSPTQQLISLFVSKRQKDKAIHPPSQQNKAQKESYQQVMSFKFNLTPLKQPIEFQKQAGEEIVDKIERQNEQIQHQNSMKRNFNSFMPAQIFDQQLVKKIKPNEDQRQRQRKGVVTIDIIDDQPIDQLIGMDKTKPLRQRIQNQLNSMLQDNIRIAQILKDSEQPEMKPAHIPNDSASAQEDNCKTCKRHEEYNHQLKYLFNELLQISQEINFDNLFLQQQTFSVLSSLNPNTHPYGSPSPFLRTDKMTDISDNSSFRLLISRKIANSNEIPEIVKCYSLQKLIKMGEEWISIFKVADLSQKRQHFKYVLASDLARCQRELVVSFLKK